MTSLTMLVVLGPTSQAEPAPVDQADDVAAVTQAAKAPAPFTPKNGTIFNNPRGSNAAAERINDVLDKTIDAAPPGSTIRMAMYLFNVDTTATKLIRAHQRGVNVKILIDDGERRADIVRVRRALGTNKKARSFVAKCKRSCMSNTTSVMHSKFYLFSQAGSARTVSMFGSANPYKGNIYNSWNDAHTVVGNKAIYTALYKYFNNMLKDKTNLNYYRTASSGKYKLYFFPRKRGVTILEVLKGVRCTGVKKGYGSGGRTVIRIGQWGWTAPRADIARQLSALQGRGCKVEVIINKARTSRKVFAPLLRNTRYGKVKIYDAWYDGNNNGVAGLYVHHKVLAINGRWFSSKGTKIVYTGSQNYTEEGNRVNDELIVRIRDNSTYTRYVKNLNYVRAHGTKGRITTVPARIDGRAAARLLQQDQADQGRVVEKEAGPDIPMIDDDGFQRPLGGDVDFDG